MGPKAPIVGYLDLLGGVILEKQVRQGASPAVCSLEAVLLGLYLRVLATFSRWNQNWKRIEPDPGCRV